MHLKFTDPAPHFCWCLKQKVTTKRNVLICLIPITCCCICWMTMKILSTTLSALNVYT